MPIGKVATSPVALAGALSERSVFAHFSPSANVSSISGGSVFLHFIPGPPSPPSSSCPLWCPSPSPSPNRFASASSYSCSSSFSYFRLMFLSRTTTRNRRRCSLARNPIDVLSVARVREEHRDSHRLFETHSLRPI